jgi:hypothetical protein
MIDLVGQKIGKLIVIKQTGKNKGGNYKWLCLCDCGKETVIRGGDLRNGHTKSCGCLKIEKITIHGCSIKSKKFGTYTSWEGMNQRCNNPNHKYYFYYGGRGIKICKRWRKFPNFLKDMGERPIRYQIDRIDNNGNYCKSNCRWVTRKQQARNKRNNHLIFYGGKTQCISAWSEEMGISEDVLRNRFERGWLIERALITPVQKHTKRS